MRRTIAPGVCTMMVVLLSALSAQVPDEVQNVTWCAGTKDCLVWSPDPGAASYNLYLGHAPDLPGLLDTAIDSCRLGTVSTATADSAGDPAPGGLDWYLVTAASPGGEGPVGSGSSGARVLDISGPCLAEAGLVLNEIDYDQPGTDSGEFVEIYNVGGADRALAGLVLIRVNGLTEQEYARTELNLAGSVLPPGGHLVVGSPNVVASLPAGTLSITFPASTNNIQNGAPDGVALFDTGSQTLIDALSYEGSIEAAQFDDIPGTFNLLEGTPTTVADSNSVSGSLVRFPDGSDTDDANTDWSFSSIPTPGIPNPIP